MTQPIELSQKNWLRLQEQIRDDYPLSVSLIRSKMKKVLGFTPREYNGYSPDNSYYRTCVMLDFYSEKKRTFFIMKYGEYLNV
jgi:hypothetical protein